MSTQHILDNIYSQAKHYDTAQLRILQSDINDLLNIMSTAQHKEPDIQDGDIVRGIGVYSSQTGSASPSDEIDS